MFGHREMVVDDYISILRRRKWWLIVPVVIGPVLGYGISRFLPEKYTSQTMVLVQQQRVPDRFVPSVVVDTLPQRLSTMRDQILSRTQLQPLIEKYQLYKDTNAPMEDLVNKMRGNIAVQNMVANQGGSGGPVSGFSIAFTADDPHVAQQITGQILSMFIEQNVKLREESAQNTTDFLSKQLEEAQRKLDEQDARLADFKRRNIGQLPGQEGASLSLLMSSTAQYEAVTQALNRAVQDKQFAETMLANQIQQWEASQSGSNPVTIDAQVTALQNQLTTARAKYTDDHPDVVKIKNEIDQLKERLTQAPTTEPAPAAVPKVEPPQIAAIRGAIHQHNMTIKEKTREQERYRDLIRQFQSRVQLSPAIEQEYKDLTRDHQNALSFYSELLAKRTQSEMSTNLEKRQQGEQFKVMDSPNLPERPTFPNRPMFAAGGLGAGLMLGLAMAIVLEFRDKSLRNELDIEQCLQLPALVSLPSVDGIAAVALPALPGKTKG